MNCPTCDNPMVWSDEIGEVWCSVYGTHEPWPWHREWDRLIEKSNTAVRTAINDRLIHKDESYSHGIHTTYTPLCTSDPQGSTPTMEVGGIH